MNKKVKLVFIFWILTSVVAAVMKISRIEYSEYAIRISLIFMFGFTFSFIYHFLTKKEK